MKRAIFSRICSSISRANEESHGWFNVESCASATATSDYSPYISLRRTISSGLLRGIPANAFAVASEIPFAHFGFRFCRQRVKDEPNRFFRCASARPGYAGDSDAERCSAAFTNAFGQRGCHFTAYGAVFSIMSAGTSAKLSLQIVRVHNRATEKISRTSADRCDAFRQQSACAGFRHCQRRAPHLQIVADDLFQRVAVIARTRNPRVPLQCLPSAGPHAPALPAMCWLEFSDAAEFLPHPRGSWFAHLCSAV